MSTASDPPLVTCIMPTADRRAFVPRAIDYFLRQDYPNAELVIVDDGDEPIADLVPADQYVRYVRLRGRQSVGAKRNLACEQARGAIIAHWDDDDWHAPHRLSYQIDALLRAGADLCGINQMLFYDLRDGRAWRYIYPSRWTLWLAGSTLCYTRAFWSANRFAHINVGEDARFVAAARPEHVVVLPESAFHVGMIHGRNVSPKQIGSACWQPYAADEIQRLLGDDWSRYQLYPLAPTPMTQPVLRARERVDAAAQVERTLPMMTYAQTSDLRLPEYAALGHGQPLPWMRRWELPFALYQAQLDNTMAVLDCTINPAGFAERIAALYPHVLYRHHNPIQAGRFAPPAGLPESGFDRVFCINTLEHLLRPQREQLLAALAGKLKPGGRLIITCDHYFESAWHQPAFLQSGLLRADGQEVFGGFNRVLPAELLEVCARLGLQPLDPHAQAAPPAEDDPALFCQQPPHPHACLGAVFGKPPLAPAVSKQVVLALLTWNTAVISLESLHAHAQEARMLRRLGHQPRIVVCDNGSTDGTPALLRQAADEIDLPIELILNPDNRGNSIARNQIIGAFERADGDYLLLVDGDIEVVPGSSFAMLRYMENAGRQIGCIGANSASQTPYRERASAYCYSIAPASVLTTNLVAWTQYGMFRREIFADGVRFDESEPFDRAGWGFEDNDLAFQIDQRGYLNHYFGGMIYLHRALHSSVRLLRESGLNPALLCAQRKQYVIDKWSRNPSISQGPLVEVRQMNLHI